MARRNRKKKFKNMHRKDLEKNKKDMLVFETKMKKNEEEVKDEILGEERSGMEVEGTVKKKRKIRKNKLFQKRILIQERKRLKRIRKAPILRRNGDMETE